MNQFPCQRLLFCILALAASGAGLVAQCTRTWTVGSLPGANNRVTCAIEWDADGAGPAPARLVVGGYFTAIGAVATRGIAIYDDVSGQWGPLGTGIQGGVDALAAMPNGDLIAGGGFAIAGGTIVNNVARWNGSTWTGLGSGTDSGVTALAVLPSGDLVAGGLFSNAGGSLVNRVARWNGTTWSPFLTGLPNAIVQALAVMSDGSLVAGVNAGVMRWDGLSWNAIASFSGMTYALCALPGGQLLVGGNFLSINGVTMGRVARWSGATWQPLGSGFNTDVYALTVLPNGDYLAGGMIGQTGSTPVRHVARWNGSTWLPLGSGLGGRVDDICVRGNGQYVAVGDFPAEGVSGGLRVARWNGTDWNPLGFGCDNEVRCVVSDGAGLVVGGAFSRVADIAASRVARWSGSAWTALSGLPSTPYALARAPNGDLVAAGYFAVGSQIVGVMRWDGTNWTPWSGATTTGSVSAIAVMPNGDIVVGGSFTSLGGVALANVARWNGTAWTPLGSGITGSVDALAVAPNGDLLVGGLLASAGGVPVTSLAVWNGTAWSATPGSFSHVNAIAIGPTGEVVIGGASFLQAHVARWSGSTLLPLGGGMNGEVHSLRFLPDGTLLAGGDFTAAGGVAAARTARWNGSTWSGFLPVSDGSVEALAMSPDGTVWVGGTFTSQPGGALGFLANSVASCPALVTSYGAGCVGGAGLLQTTALARPWLGSTFFATTTGLPSLSIGVCVRGFAPTTQQLWQLIPGGQPGCELLVSPTTLTVQLPVGGATTTSLFIPTSISLAGLNVEEQMVVVELDALGSIASVTSANGILLTLGAL